jgi:hypothetical protein
MHYKLSREKYMILKTIIIKYFLKIGCGQNWGSFEEEHSEGTLQVS